MKKAGIIVAAAATGVLAMTSLAFADTTTSGNVSNDCTFGNQGGAPAGIADQGSSLLGALGAVSSIVTDATSQANTGNCTNLNVTDLVNSDSNNRTKSIEKSWIDGSFNGGDEMAPTAP